MKKIRHRLSQTAVASQFSWPRTWCAWWFGQIDFQTIPGIRGSTSYDYKTRDEAAYEPSSKNKPLSATDANQLPYLHLGSKVEKKKKYG